jgi:hypothetical protein
MFCKGNIPLRNRIRKAIQMVRVYADLKWNYIPIRCATTDSTSDYMGGAKQTVDERRSLSFNL